MTLLDILLVILATYRIATDIAWEDGPFELYTKVRSAAGAWFGYTHWIANGIACPICVSFWASIAILGVQQAHIVGWWLVLWLAIAGAVAFLARSKAS